MLRFFLQLHECGKLVEDEEGFEVPSLAEAMARSRKEALSVMADEVSKGTLCLSCYIVVEDMEHQEIGRTMFRDILTITGL